MATSEKTANAQKKWQILPPQYFSDIPDVEYYYFQTVLLGDVEDDYRIYDCKGGFYICLQIIVTKKEYQQGEKFDQIKRQQAYLMHCISMDSPNSDADSDGSEVQWTIPQYRTYFLKIPSLQSLDTINFETIANNPGWKPEEVEGTYLQYLLPRNQLSEHAREVRKAKPEPQPQWRAEIGGTEEKAPRFDMSLIHKLKAQGLYDTIVKTDSSTLYMNTDYVSYEIADDPEIFYVKEQEYYPNGMLKSRKYFIAGVYTNESLPVGTSSFYDKKGNFVYSSYPEDEYYMFPQFDCVNFEFLLRFLEKRNIIDSKTGKGKPVMKINSNVDPHAPSFGTPRLSIISNWQIQVDDKPNGGTVALLIKNDNGTETVFIFEKNNRMILDKFNRLY